MSSKNKFLIKRKGYDRSAVDSYIDNLNQEFDFSKAKLEVFKKQTEFLSLQLEVKQEQNIELMKEIKVLQDNSEKIELVRDKDRRLITVAQQTADEIILEALMIAQEILNNLSETALNTKEYKGELVETLERILKSVHEIELLEPSELKID